MARPQTISDQQILETALKCFLEHGPAVSTDVIAAELGVSSQAIFKRFHNKQELLIESVKPREDPNWIGIIENGPDERSFQIQLAELLNELAVFFTDIVRRMELLRWSGVAIQEIMQSFEEPPPVRDIRKISTWLERCHAKDLIREIDFDATAMIILTSMHGPAMLREFLGRNATNHSEQEYISLYTNMLMHGLCHSTDFELNTKEL
jgi:AcrR family transcriptional regulator